MSELKSVIPSGIAFVTGGARGLGNAVAVSFAQLGATGVVLVDIEDEEGFKAGKEAVENCGVKCITIKANVTKEDDVQRAIAETVREFGRIDYAANFAGIAGSVAMSWDLPLEQWLKVIDVNQTGVWLCTKYELKQMLTQEPLGSGTPRRQRGSIVNCASINSILAVATAGGYTTSKHAVIGITKTAAVEARKQDIRVNAVSPGFVRTRLVTDSVKNVDEALKECEARQGRAALVEDIGDAVALLSSPKMALVNGHNLVIDGGFTVSYGQ